MQLKRLISKVLPMSTLRCCKNFYTLSYKYGQMKSIKTRSCLDHNGNEIPWYTYPAIEYLDSLDFTGKDVLEYGAGASSSWWSERAKSVISIEDNKDWYDAVLGRENTNLKIILAENEKEYVKAGNANKYDVIVIDGKHRIACAKNVAEILKEDGLVIFDNSDRYPQTSKLLRDKFDLIQVDLHGFGPINAYTWTTSLFMSRNFRPNPKSGRLPVYSLGSIKEHAE